MKKMVNVMKKTLIALMTLSMLMSMMCVSAMAKEKDENPGKGHVVTEENPNKTENPGNGNNGNSGNNNHNDDFKIHVNGIDDLMKDLGVEGAGTITLTTKDGNSFELNYKGSGSNLTSGNDQANKEGLKDVTLSYDDKQIDLTLTTHGKGNTKDSITGQDEYWIEYTKSGSDTTITDPIVTDPIVTDPIVTDPIVTDPIVTDPVVTDTTVTENNTLRPSKPAVKHETTDTAEEEVELVEEAVPVAELPEEEVELTEEEVPMMELPEEEVPMAQAPETGDAALLWALVAAMSGIALAWLTISGRKCREEKA